MVCMCAINWNLYELYFVRIGDIIEKKTKRVFMKTINSNRKMLAVILALAWPTMLEQLMHTAVQYVDMAMVGSLGTQATAAVGATTTVNWLVGSTVSALGVGFLAQIAQALGAGEQQKAKRLAAQTMLVTLCAGLLFTVLTVCISGVLPRWMQVDLPVRKLASRYFLILYLPMLPRAAITLFSTVLRAAGDTKTPMKVGMLTNLINVTLNFLLIFPTRTLWGVRVPGADLGVVGAALASAISFVVGSIYITIVLWRHPVISPRHQPMRPDRQLLSPCMKISLPNMLQRFATSSGYVAYASMVNSIGSVATAAHSVANTVESLFYIPGYGMQAAAATLAGNACGAKDRARLKRTANMFVPLVIGLMTVCAGALFVSARVLMQLFSDNPQVIDLGTTVLRMVAFSEPFYGVPIIIEGMMHGVGKTKKPFIYNTAGMWGIRIVGTFICTQWLDMGLVSAWACMIAHNMLLFVLYMRAWRRGDIEETGEF